MAVELFDPSRKYAAPAGAHLTYMGGELLTRAMLVGVFVNELSGSEYALKAQVVPFLDWLGGGSIFSEMAEYNTAGFVLAPGSHVGDFDVSLGQSAPPPPPPPTPCDCQQCLQDCFGFGGVGHHHGHLSEMLALANAKHAASGTVLQDADVQALLANAIAQGSVPAPQTDTLYLMFFPTGVTIQMQGQSSCQDFCGYHDQFQLSSGQNVQYAVLPFPDCAGCLGGLSQIDAITGVTTHEVAEAITDPAPGSGWYDQANGEVGDICAWTFRRDSGFNVQLLWSDQKNACI